MSLVTVGESARPITLIFYADAISLLIDATKTATAATQAGLKLVLELRAVDAEKMQDRYQSSCRVVCEYYCW